MLHNFKFEPSAAPPAVELNQDQLLIETELARLRGVSADLRTRAQVVGCTIAKVRNLGLKYEADKRKLKDKYAKLGAKKDADIPSLGELYAAEYIQLQRSFLEQFNQLSDQGAA